MRVNVIALADDAGDFRVRRDADVLASIAIQKVDGGRTTTKERHVRIANKISTRCISMRVPVAGPVNLRLGSCRR